MKFTIGDHVETVSGPYPGLSGVVVSIDEDRRFPYRVKFDSGDPVPELSYTEDELELDYPALEDKDEVNHPSHYADGWSNGAEVIDITENLNFNRGNAIKYLARAGKKDPDKEIQDLLKARFYINRELKRMGAI